MDGCASAACSTAGWISPAPRSSRAARSPKNTLKAAITWSIAKSGSRTPTAKRQPPAPPPSFCLRAPRADEVNAMPIRRQFPPRSLDAAALIEGGVDPHYTKVFVRLLAAHAMAEKLTALGYQRALATLDNPALLPTVEKNFAEEKKHARLI